MNTGNTNLVTTYTFRGKEYIVNINSSKHHIGNIEIKVTEKKTSEQWLGSYDASYIENLTQKTGNYKRFDTFISMLKSGLLSTSQCVTLDLLTYEDLEMLRNRVSHSRGFSAPNSSHIFAPLSSNRRYLIVTYTVEFDRIHYPLAMEYLGPPDPRILQETIQRLEKQVADLQHKLSGSNWEEISNQIDLLQRKVVDVTTENVLLKEQTKQFNNNLKDKQSRKEMEMLMKSIYSLENKLKIEYENVENLQKENSKLSFQLGEAFRTEKLLRAQLNVFQFKPHSNNKAFLKKSYSPLGLPSYNRSLDYCAEKPFHRHKSVERKVRSARSSFDFARSSSEDSITGGSTKGKVRERLQYKQFPRARTSSPSFSDLSHNSGVSRCACRNCLQSKYMKRQDQSGNMKKHEKGRSKAVLMKRIQSLEKLVSGIVLN